LLNGHSGTAAAGHVIQAFGDFVVGGNYAVGLVFSILVIINFVVVTKGAGRISEVSARFTLDAMPGKQMAIDADLNAGLINQEEAKARRNDVVQEADFYGAMDGASKFVRGDAIAGILILLINIIGGLAVGMLQHHMAFTNAIHNYTLLTIGDGLVAQIPSLVLSTAAAIIVTRVSDEQDMGGQILSQLFNNPRTLGITAIVMGMIGVVPGMPNLVFLALSGSCGAGAYFIAQRKKTEDEARALVPSEEPEMPPEARELSWDDVVPVDPIGLEVGYRLIPLVDKSQGGQLMGRIKGVRKKLTSELGFLIPPVHIRDNLELTPNSYRISLLGVTVGEAEIHPDRVLAINPGQVFGTVEGIPTKDPAFGLDAYWLETSQRDQAQTLGYTVVDANTVLATHLSQVIQDHASELLGHEEAQQLLDNLAKSAPKLVEDLIPEKVSLGALVKVLQNLLEEHIPVRDIRTIAETLAEQAARSQDPAILTASVRVSLGRMIFQNINGMNNELEVIALDPSLEQILQDVLRSGDGTSPALEPSMAEKMHKALVESAQRQEAAGKPVVLLVSAPIRPLMARFVKHSIPSLNVLAYNEVPDNKRIRVVASVGS
ncbi:MAG TPA: flagellar biosynthesis protein FlhA, partial [Gammaproteobacteria bacterium]|nr:flagellar biosynthesis protein FlhA [Gammaproteobacteria bacterium]